MYTEKIERVHKMLTKSLSKGLKNLSYYSQNVLVSSIDQNISGKKENKLKVKYLVAFFLDSSRKQTMNPQSFNIWLGEVSVKLPQVVYGQHDAEQVDQDPNGIQNIVSIWALRQSSDFLDHFLEFSFPELVDKMAHP